MWRVWRKTLAAAATGAPVVARLLVLSPKPSARCSLNSVVNRQCNRLRTIGFMHTDVALLKQAISFVGALMILIAYAGHQMGWMNSRSALYNVLNAAGSGILLYI